MPIANSRGIFWEISFSINSTFAVSKKQTEFLLKEGPDPAINWTPMTIQRIILKNTILVPRVFSLSSMAAAAILESEKTLGMRLEKHVNSQPRSQGSLSCFEKEPWLRLVAWKCVAINCAAGVDPPLNFVQEPINWSLHFPWDLGIMK